MSTDLHEPSVPRRRRPVDLTALVAGLVFVVLGVVDLVAEAGDTDVDVAWAFATTLVALGVLVLAAGAVRVLRGRAPHEPDDDRSTPADDAATGTTPADGAPDRPAG